MLHEVGFEVIRLPFEPTTRARRSLRECLARAQPIFNYNEKAARDDGKRLQVSVPRDGSRALAMLRDGVASVVPRGHVCGEWVALLSEPGCQRQHPHCDYNPDVVRHLRDEHMPLAAVVGVEPGTRLIVWPGCIRGRVPGEGDEGTTVAIEPGTALLFRGDLVHAGAAYEHANARLHVYVDHPATQREADRTYLC